MLPAPSDTSLRPNRRSLYRWQFDALVSWLQCGRRGVIEAVTGSGKTDVALTAAIDARRRGLFVLIVVPSRVLIEQWHQRVAATMPGAKIGRLGDASRDEPADCDILIATRHSAAARRPAPPTDAGGLLIADECHGYGGTVLRKALLPEYGERMGLTATLERSDDAVEELLLPFFGGVCYRYGFEAAISDGVCAQPRVAFVAVPLSETERMEYVATEGQLVAARQHLRKVRGVPHEPFGAFLGAVNHLAERDAGPDGRAARRYLDAFGRRRDIVASSESKYEALGRLAPSIQQADGALLFTETVRAANHAINRLDPHVAVDIITGSTPRADRQEILEDLRGRRLDAVAAPRVLDEGIDVPDANLGVVLSASRTRRQMVQRMGRILRRKGAGRGARFVIVFARDTLEDPRMRMDRDGFLDEIERVAAAARVFEVGEFESLTEFLNWTGPDHIIEPVLVGPLGALPSDEEYRDDAIEPVRQLPKLSLLRSGDPEAWGQAADAAAQRPELIEELWVDLTPEVLYAHLAFLDWTGIGPLHDEIFQRNPAPIPEEPPYLDLDTDTVDLPAIRTPKVVPKRLSTGEQPLKLMKDGAEWLLVCTGCGQTSDRARLRWKALDQTVSCNCE